MSDALTGLNISESYKRLLQIPLNTGVDDTERVVRDGEGIATAMKISTDSLQVKNATSTDVLNTFLVTDKDDNSILSVDGINNRVGIGALSPEYDLDMNKSAGDMVLSIKSWSTTATHSGHLSFRKSNNNTIGTETLLQANDEIGLINFIGAKGTDAWHTGATILSKTSDTWNTSSDCPTVLEFRTTRDGTATLSSIADMIISNTAVGATIGIGVATPDKNLQIQGTGHTEMHVDAPNGAYDAILSLDAGSDAVDSKVEFKYTGTTQGSIIYDHNSTGANEVMKLNVNSSDRIVIDGNGKVGIGVTPTANMVGLSVEAGVITLKETTEPTADANYGKIYTKDDNKLYFQDGSGTEHEIEFA